MNNKLIDNIVWWIPFKNLRNFVREFLILLLTFNKKVSELDNRISELDNRLIAVNNNMPISFSDFENINDLENNQNQYEYNYIFSIGENCFTANLLKDNNLRKYSGPLDWLTPLEYSKINLISNLQLINNEFQYFFDKKNLSFVGKTYYGSSIYFDSGSFLYYPHDFKENDNFDTEYESAYFKYKNRINRTIDFMKNGNNKILMVYIEYYKLFNNLDIFNTISWLDSIRNKYKNDNIDLLYIKHNYFIEKDVINFKLIDNKLHLYIMDNSFDYNYNSSYYLHSWAGNVSNTSKILQRYKLI